MVRRASLKDVTKKKVPKFESKKGNINYNLTMIHETSETDEDGLRLEYKLELPCSGGDFREFIKSIMSSREDASHRDFMYKIKRAWNRKGETLVDEVSKYTILMGFSIKTDTFEDELVFRIFATNTILNGAMHKLYSEISGVFNKVQSEDELKVKWWMIKKALSGHAIYCKRPEEYAHGFDVLEDGIGHNVVHGNRLGCAVLLSDIDVRTMKELNEYSMIKVHDKFYWGLSNFTPANVREIGNIEFVMEDNRRKKGNFYGVRYKIENDRFELDGEDTLYDVFLRRHKINSVTKIKVELGDLNADVESIVGQKRRKCYNVKRGIELRDGKSSFGNYRGGKVEGVKNDTYDDIGIYKTINYSNLFRGVDRANGITYKYKEGHGDILYGENDKYATFGNTSDAFQFLYLNDKKFKEDVDGYFKVFKDAGIDMFKSMLKDTENINLVLMLLFKFSNIEEENKGFFRHLDNR